MVTLFLALDAGMKLIGAQPAVATTGELGFSEAATRLLGLVLGISTLLYLVPKTRILGAILLTGYLGGAVAVQARNGASVLTHVLFGVYLGMAAWGALWLRDEDLRRQLPFDRNSGT
jgi:hypothetical protein